METPRPEKVAIVDEVRERVSASDAVILTEYRGLSVAALAELRAKLGDAGGDYKIYKNTLVRLATRDLDSAEMAELLTGPTALAFVRGDVAEVAKVLRDFSRTNPSLVMKGGLLGDRVFDASDAARIASLEPRAVMLAKLAGLLQAPMAQFASLLQAPMQQFAGLVTALIESRGGAGEPEAATPADASGAEPEAATPADAPESESSESE